MSVFVDTNVFLRSVQPTHPSHGAAVRGVARLIREGESLVVTPQILTFNGDDFSRYRIEVVTPS